jgi:hypothetical protein
MDSKPLFDPNFNPERAESGDPFPFDTAITGLVEATDGPIDFTPVPRLRKRRNGWTPETQRAFIDALSRCGCVARAARAVGKTPRSAYRLLESEGAESFAEAWDQAIARGVDALRWNALDRALHGAWVPVVRRGRIVSFEHRRSDRLAIALLSGRKASVADNRERASSRRKYRMKLAAEKKAQAEDRRRRETLWAEHQAVLERDEQRAQSVRGTGEHDADRQNRVCRTPPRIRSL